jgi:diacylglycerol kinase (ATP)
MKSDKVLLIYNPRAGSGLFKSSLDRILELFQNEKKFVVPVRTDSPDLLNDVVKETKKIEFEKIIVAGGDGTIHAVVNAMINNDVDLPLAIFPSGTANDFAYYFDIPHNIDGMVNIALGDNYTLCDVGKINEKYFINVAAMGFLVDVSQKTDPDVKNTLGIISYYLKGVSEFPKLQPLPITIQSKEYSGSERMYFMLVMNGRSAGGFKRVGAHAEINDGLLDVLVFRELPLTELPVLLLNFMQGHHAENKNVLYFKTDSLYVESEVAISTDMDGEKGCNFPLSISCIPKKLRINTQRENMEGSNW